MKTHKVNYNDHENVNINVNNNDSDDRSEQTLTVAFSPTIKVKPILNVQISYTNPGNGETDKEKKENKENKISTNINGDLQSWLHNDDNIVNAIFPENIRCIISGSSECGKTFFLKELIISNIYFDKLCIICPTGDQKEAEEIYNDKAIVEFFKDVKNLRSPDKLPKELKKLMMFDDDKTKEPILNYTFVEVEIIIVI